MFNISKKSVIYVVCPYYNKTGGTELMHQLVYTINQLGGNAMIAYYGDSNAQKEINPAFSNYVDQFIDVSEIIDSSENIVILPEIKPDLADDLKLIQKTVWWMSVDNYLKRNGFFGSVKYFGVCQSVKFLLKGNIKLGGYKIDKVIPHLYQSEYAHQFLKSEGVLQTHRLSDYLNESYIEGENLASKREDIVLYNPKKGIEYTQQIIKASPELNFIPIENMTTEQVRALLQKSKVYIDFGNHPGKDRFPREAAISGCCVITGKRGSAQFQEDIPIPYKYKFEDSLGNIPDIVETVKQCLAKYEEHLADFENYREFIKSEQNIFYKDVEDLFTVK